MNTNPLMFDSNINISQKQSILIRHNYTYIMTLLSNLIYYEGDIDKVIAKSPSKITQASSEKLPYSDKLTGYDTNHLDKKLHDLVEILNENPIMPDYRDIDTGKPMTARQVFSRSIFSLNFTNLFQGDADKNSPYLWKSYKFAPMGNVSENDRKRYEKRNALSAALDIYQQSPNTRIGIDISKAFDLLLKPGANGKYRLAPDNTLKASEMLANAITEQTKIFKNAPAFQNMFHVVENEDEKF